MSRLSAFVTLPQTAALALVVGACGAAACTGDLRSQDKSTSEPALTSDLPASSQSAEFESKRTQGYSVRSLQEASDRSVLRAFNQAQDFEADFRSDGIDLRALRSQGAWRGALAFTAYGCRDNVAPLLPAEPKASGAQVLYTRQDRRGRSLTEWYVNDERGLEQGFTLPVSPGCDGEVEIALQVRGALRARVDSTGHSVELLGPQGAPVLKYKNLVVRDARGRHLRSRLAVTDDRLSLLFDSSGAEFPVLVDPYLSAALEQKIVPGTGAVGVTFGQSVALSQNTVLATGAVSASSQYTLWGNFLVRSGVTWAYQAKVQGHSPLTWQPQGSAALDGEVAALGVIDAKLVRLWRRTGTTWTQEQEVTGSANYFGISSSVSGDTLVIGSPLDLSCGCHPTKYCGKAFVWFRSGGAWAQQAVLSKCTSWDEYGNQFGESVSASGDSIVVGSPFGPTATSNGSVDVFVRSGTTWALEQTLSTSASVTSQHFGKSVSISGDTVVAGAKAEATTYGGQARVYARNYGAWTVQQDLAPVGLAVGDGFGLSVSVSGNVAVVGASGDDAKGTDAGAAYVFQRSGTVWSLVAKVLADDGAAGDAFGTSVSVSGDTVAIGAPKDEAGIGAAYLLRLRLSDGELCSSDVQCQSLHCVDGVCCNSVCTGLCQACSAALKGGGTNGVCDSIALGTDPQNECTDDGSPTCQKNGFCDGAGACQLYPVQSNCTPQPCTAGTQCTSGFCVDGLCCNDACSATCKACTAALKGGGPDGLCGFINDGLDPQNECGEMGTPPCKGDGLCNGMGNCRSSLKDVLCGPASCASAYAEKQADHCDGQGICQTGVVVDCGPYRCSGTACLTSCSTINDCEAPNECLGGKCGDGKSNGESCQMDTDCSSLHCVESVCCNLACTGSCESCLAGRKASHTDTGECGAIQAGTDPKNLCVKAAEECGADGFCDGLGACRTFAPNTTACGGDKVCESATVLVTKKCDGAGTCAVASSQACTPYTCSQGICVQSCANSSQCASGYFCASSLCTAKKALGESCTTAEHCSSSQCVEGVCCDSACDTGCVSCLAANKASGTNGTCGPVLEGTDPFNDCTKSATNECGEDGLCNGQGACRSFAPSTTQCQGGTVCQSETVAVGMMCNGSGSCLQSPGTACAPYKCASTTGSCLKSCNTSAECAAGHFCKSSACVAKYPNGQACLSVEQCESGFCTEGVCCNAECSGSCMSCVGNTTGGLDGVCQNVLKGSADPKKACTVSSNPCGSDGTCGDNGLCNAFRPAGAACGSASCTDPSTLGKKECDGFGVCEVQAESCAPFGCDSSTKLCKKSCQVSSDCATGFFCSGGACIAVHLNGQSCGSGDQCQSQFCVGGICCDSACGSACKSCVALKTGATDGTCADVLAGTLDPNGKCAVSSDFCGADGSCAAGGQCAQFRPKGAVCGPASCNGGVLVQKTCNGAGACEQDDQSCDAYACDPQTLKCKTACTTSADCSAKHFCEANTCKSSRANGEACTTGDECQSSFCTESLCCDSACKGACKSCVGNLTGGTDGVCGNVKAGGDDPSKSCKKAAEPCGADGLCDGLGACRAAAPAGAACGINSCETTAVMKKECDGTGSCVSATVKNCTPYACDSAANNCKTTCKTNSDCATGAECNAQTGQCGGTSATCKDPYTVRETDGSESSCVPYKCVAGVCRENCDVSSDCASGYECVGKTCAKTSGDAGGSTAGSTGDPAIPGPSAQESGCGCRVQSSGTRLPWLWTAIGLFALGTRRRKGA